MLNRFKKKISEKGQGLTEYVLILAFIAGIAFMMFGGNGSLRGTLVNTFSETVSILGGLFGENDGYVTASQKYPDYFKKYKGENGIVTTEDLKREASSEERLKVDQEGLALIGNFFLDLTQSQVEKLMGVGVGNDQNQGYSNTFSSAPSWLTTNLDASRMGPVNDNWSEIMVPLSYWNTNLDNDGYIWLEASKNVNLIKDMAGEVDQPITATKNNVTVTHDGQNFKRTGLTDRVFYSDGMIGSDSSNRAVTVQVHYDGDGVVDKVRVQAVEGVKQQNKQIEYVKDKFDGYDMSPGYSALLGESGESKPVKGLDLTVIGSKDNYKYKVN